MNNELYEKAAEQAFEIAKKGGEIAPYFIFIGLALLIFGSYMFYLELKATLYKSYIGRALIGWVFGVVLFLAGIFGWCESRQAKEYPELFILEKLNRPQRLR